MKLHARPRPVWADMVGAAGRGLALLSGLGMLLMMITGTLDIFGTNVLAWPIPAAFEFMTAMMVVVVFFALSLAQARKAHIRVEILYEHMPRTLQRITDVFQYALSAIFFGLIAWFGWISAHEGFLIGEFASGIVNFPLWPARYAMALGATLMAMQCLVDLAGVIFGWSTDDSGDSNVGGAS